MSAPSPSAISIRHERPDYTKHTRIYKAFDPKDGSGLYGDLPNLFTLMGSDQIQGIPGGLMDPTMGPYVNPHMTSTHQPNMGYITLWSDPRDCNTQVVLNPMLISTLVGILNVTCVSCGGLFGESACIAV